LSNGGEAVGGVRVGLGHARWALALTRAAQPRLFIAYWLNAIVGMGCPAGIALSVRGLVNAVEAGIVKSPDFHVDRVYLWLAIGFCATLAMVLTGAFGRYMSRRFEVELASRLRLDVLTHGEAMSCRQRERKEFQDELLRASEQPERHVGQFLTHGVGLIVKVVQGASLMAILVAIEPLLVVLLVPIALPYLLFKWRLAHRHFVEVDAQTAKRRRVTYYARLLGEPEQAAEVTLLGLGPVLLERTRVLLGELRTLLLRYLRLEILGTLAFSILTVGAVYWAMSRAAFAIIDGQLTIGDLAIYGSAATQLRALVDTGITLIASLRFEVLHVGNLRRFLQTPIDDAAATSVASSTPDTKDAERLRGDIAFDNVAFRYPDADRPVLDGLSFRIDAGETVALVGHNGAGKTTVAKLIARLYEPEAGAITFDGVDARALSVASIRAQVAAVFQHFGRYAVSAGDNVAFGDWPRLLDDPAKTQDVARRAGIEEIIERMPEGYDTMLGRAFGAHEPSGGEWQQLAIGRALARDARILILDEPTANLDIEAEARLFERFRELAAGRTTLLVSHRFASVRMADRIFVLHGGRLLESGTHDELMRAHGRYAALYEQHRRHLGPD
jgi:ATP-binding cassette subfamily B protein